MKQSMITSTLLAGMVALSACGGNEQSQSTNGDSSAAPKPDKVVARVNGEPISAAQLDAQIQAQSKRGKQASKDKALKRLVDLTVLAQKAEEKGLAEQPGIAAKIKRQRASVLAQHLVRAELSNYSPSEDELRQAYKERVSGQSGKEYKARHILLDKEEKAKTMIDKLDQGGNFAKLAKEHSTGPTSKRGGSLGWFQAQQMVKPFGDALKSLKPGNYTQEPVKTRFGWHVVKLEDVREKQKPKFEKMKSKLRNQLVSKHIESYIGSLREKADIKIKADKGKSGTSSGSDSASNGSGEAGGSSGSESGSSEGGAY